MKNKKICLMILMVVGLFFVGINKVFATGESIVGWGTCKYTMEDSSMASTYKKYVDSNMRVDGNSIVIGFSEIIHDKTNLFAKDSKDGWWAVFDEGKNQFAEDNFNNNGSQLSVDFYQIYNATGKCPKYLIFKNASSGVDSIFTDDKDSYCSANNCPFIADNKDSKFNKVNAGETEWNTTVSGCSYATPATVKFYVEGSTKLMAKIILPKSSTGYSVDGGAIDGDGNKVFTVAPRCDGWSNCAIGIEQLVVSKNMSSMYFSVDGNSTGVYFNKGAIPNFTDYCYLNSVATFNETKNCKTVAQTDVSTKYNSLVSAKTATYNALKEYVNYNTVPYSPGYSYTAKSFTGLTVDQIKSKVTSLSTAIGNNSFASSEKTFEDYLDDIKDEICASELNSLNKYYENAENLASENEAILSAAKIALNNLKKAAEEYDDEELNELVDDTETKIDDKIKESKTIVTRLENKTKMNDGKSFTLNKANGCSIISEDMKSFLNTVLWYLKIVGTALAIILSLIDYIKAAAGDPDKSMEAANKKFFTRMILVVVLFMLPALLEFALGVLNISTTAGSLNCL